MDSQNSERASNIKILKNFFKSLPGADLRTLAGLVSDVVKTGIKPIKVQIKKVEKYDVEKTYNYKACWGMKN